MSSVTVVQARWVLADADRPVLSDAAVAFHDGVILAVGTRDGIRRDYPDATVLGSDAVAVLPGLINAHHHSGGATRLQHGTADDLLERWLMHLPLSRAGDPYLETLLSAARLLRTGVTTVVEIYNGGTDPDGFAEGAKRMLAAYGKAGMRVAFGAGFTEQSHLAHGEDERFLASLAPDLRAEAAALLPRPGGLDQDGYFAIMAELREAHSGNDRVAVWLAPPGPQWVSDGFMQRIAERAEAWDTGIQTHVQESIYERQHGRRSYGAPTIAHLADLGVLSPRFSIAHGVWLSEGETARLAETGAAVSHNPSSNLRLRAGIAPLNALLAGGVTTALGTDGMTLDDDEDMFAEMRLALRLHRTPVLDGPAPTTAQVFAMATRGGARLLRQETRLGRLAPGYAADMVLVDLARLTWPWTAPEADPRDLVLLRARADDVRSVIVGGEIVFQDGRPTRFDLDAAGRAFADELDAKPFPAALAGTVERLQPRVGDYYRSWEIGAVDPYTIYNSRK